MNILICDDMQREIDKLDRLLKASGYAVNTVGFFNGADALDYVRSGKLIDCCFLDIVMPEINGIDLAKALRAADFEGEIIFLSTSHEYGPETYLVDAFGYLLKPPTPESVTALLDKIERVRNTTDTDGIKIKTRNFMRHLLFREISYVEVIKRHIYYHLVTGESVEVTATFAETAPQLLCDARFAQCHNSYIINANNVATVIGREIIMRDGAKIPLSKSYSGLKAKFMDSGLE